MIDLRCLSDFLDLARTGNFSASARNRSISQPALTRRIQQLEKWCGRLLFDRSKAPLRLTTAGEEFRPIAERLVDELQAFRKRGDRTPTGRSLRCMSLHSLGSTWLPEWLNSTVRKRLRRAIDVSFGTYDQCFAALREDQIDIALVYQSDQVREPRFKALGRTVVGREAFVPVLAVSCRPDAPASRTIIELSRENYLGNALSSAFDRAKRLPGFKAGPVASRFDAVRAFVDAGSGIGWLPRRMAAADIAAGTLRAAGDGLQEIELDIVMIAASEDNVALARSLAGEADVHRSRPHPSRRRASRPPSAKRSLRARPSRR